MFKRILFILFYLFIWVVFFEITRIYFLFRTWDYVAGVPGSLILKSFWYGLKMDLSMASYFTIPVCLFVLFGVLIPFFRKKKVFIIYTFVLLFIELLLVLADAEIYKAWGNRIDFTPVKYISNPKEMWASISHLPVFWMLLILLIVYLFLCWGFNKIISKTISLLQYAGYKYIQALLILIFMGSLIIPIRGGFQLSPLNQSSVFFCNNQYANNTAINATWNFMFSVIRMNQLSGNPYEYLKQEEAEKTVKRLFNSQGKIEQIVNQPDSIKTNVIVIIWESFTEKVLNLEVNGKKVVPYFHQLMKDGIYFSNCYSAGDRTDKGISAILSGYPALPKGSIVNYPEKTSRLSGLGNLFLKNRYNTFFYYGGEPEFANIKSYLSSQNFQNFISKNNFSESDMNSKWGAHDGVVANRLIEDLPQMKQPFFTTWLTLSSHEPFETPVTKVIVGKDNQSKFFNSLNYSDSIIYTFINKLKKMPFWNNTLLIISADHGHYLPVTGKRADDYRIPVLWLGGAVSKKNIIINKTTSQLDIAQTLAQQLHFTGNPFYFGQNLFDSSASPHAFFTFNDGIGFVTDSSRLLFDNSGKRVVFSEGKSGNDHERIAKAMMQIIYSDFLKK